MRVYSIYVIVSERDRDNVTFSRFDHPKVVEVLILGDSTLNYDVAKMLRADLIVTVGDWSENQDCIKAVQVARIMEKEVIHQSQFESYVEANYN